MIGFLKHSNTSENIVCPNCLEEQKIPQNAVSAFCKNCRSRIDIEKIQQRGAQSQPTPKWKPKTKSISCPFCHSLQDVLANAISAYCKNCHQRISIKEDASADFGKDVQVGVQREITCPHCGISQKVPSTALSSFCTECANRINLQNYEIKGRYRGNLETKGIIYISGDGILEGNINSGSAVIAGRVKGEIIADDKVSLKNTARLHGKIRASYLEADPGAVFVGHLHIGKK